MRFVLSVLAALLFTALALVADTSALGVQKIDQATSIVQAVKAKQSKACQLSLVATKKQDGSEGRNIGSVTPVDPDAPPIERVNLQDAAREIVGR